MKDLKRPVRRSAPVDEESNETLQILSSEEKRELILAHARSQTSKDPMQRMTVWGGVMIAMAAIGVGWWWTVGTSIQGTLQKGLPELQAMTDSLNQFSKTLQTESEALKKPLSPTETVNAEEYPDLMKAVIEGNNPKAPRNDLLSPGRKNNSGSASSTPQAASTTQSDTIQQLIDPTAPGLELENQASN